MRKKSSSVDYAGQREKPEKIVLPNFSLHVTKVIDELSYPIL